MTTEMLSKIPPGVIMMLGAALLPLLRGKLLILGKIWLLLLPVLSFLQLLTIPEGYTWDLTVFDFAMQPVRVDRLSLVWGYVFHLAAFLSAIYALHVDRMLEHVGAMVYAGSAIGAAFAGDLATLFLYWEATAISSVVLIWANNTQQARRQGIRYLVIQVLSGVLLLGGLVVQAAYSEHIMFGKMQLFDRAGDPDPASMLIFVAFGIKAAFPLLHSWLKNSYPHGTVTGTVFLSAFTTKLAIYALARGFAGTSILIPIGTVMTVFPIFYAVIENDLRRVLSYSLNNQLGFMVVGVGIGTELAINGAAAHAFAHIIYKGLLFMSMGAVLYRTGTIKASELGGLYKSMPLTAVFCIIGSLSISGFPGFSGFTTKAMTLTAADQWQAWGPTASLIVALGLLLASAGVVDHSGIKIPFFSFFFHDSGKRTKEAPLNMLIAMGGAALICIVIGIFPGLLYQILPFQDVAMDYLKHSTFSNNHIITSLQLLLFAALAFVIMLRTGIYPEEIPSINLDVGWIYRRAFPRVLRRLGIIIDTNYSWFRRAVIYVSGIANNVLKRYYSPGGLMGEPWSTGLATLWAALLLVIYIIIGYL